MSETLDDVRDVILEMANEREVEPLLRLIVKRLCQRAHVALARVWTLEQGDVCSRCLMRGDCAQETECLQLSASWGNPLDRAEDWSRTSGRFCRIPLGVRKVGHIASTQRPVEVRDISEGSPWIADPEWARREQIRGFIGQPLLYGNELVGVLGVFLRVTVVEQALESLRMVANHAASAIVNARAFAEIQRLRDRLESENEYLKEELTKSHRHTGVVGDSAAIQAALSKVALVAPTDTSVLVLGESGTGKELFARAIHQQSEFRQGPLVRVNCASIPRELFESEFFGHAKGAFTGAIDDRVGRFELAEQGTLFLDEIGEVPLDMQSKLLRVLQERTFERVGEATTRHAACRIVAATNRDLKQEVAKGRFREDLYYRLSVFPIEIPPLRERPDDIPCLAEHFLKIHCERFRVPTPRLKKQDRQLLKSYTWPGNVRELQNIVEQAAIRLRVEPLRFHLPQQQAGRAERHTENELEMSTDSEARTWTYQELKEFEKKNLLAALRAANWKIYGKRGAAEQLGIHPATLSSKMRAMGIKRPT